MPLKGEGITKEYSTGILPVKRFTVFNDISIEIKEGETFGLMGSSGSGKSTLGRVIAGLEPATKGSVLYRDNDISTLRGDDYRLFRRQVQVMFQDPSGALNPKKTALSSITEVLSLIKTPRSEQGPMIDNMLETVGLSGEILSRYPHQLSGGQNQRLALGRILLLKPSIVILDEPTSALDVSVQAQILHLLKKMQATHGIGYLFISHDEAVVRFMSDRIGKLDNGRLEIVK